MMIYKCDRCKKDILETSHFHMTFSGNVKVDLCKECEAQFREWLSSSMFPNEPPKENNNET